MYTVTGLIPPVHTGDDSMVYILYQRQIREPTHNCWDKGNWVVSDCWRLTLALAKLQLIRAHTLTGTVGFLHPFLCIKFLQQVLMNVLYSGRPTITFKSILILAMDWITAAFSLTVPAQRVTHTTGRQFLHETGEFRTIYCYWVSLKATMVLPLTVMVMK